MMHGRARSIASFFVCTVACVARPAWSCDIPVHLWALERWAPDPYPVVVFHGGALSEGEQAALDGLKAGAERANLVVREVDVTAPLDEPTRAVWEAQGTPRLPTMVVRHPLNVPAAVQIWSGPLDEASVDAVVDSPKRRETSAYLVEADAVVWVLLDGDEATAALLDSALAEVRKNPPAAVPTPGAPTSERVFPLPRFPVVRMSRSDPAERVFAQMLLGVEPDLKGYSEPMAFPVFGRGRALYALVGAGINAKTVRNACAFLVNGCSCQVKEQNPGMDLLLAVDWKGRVGEVLTGEVSELPSLPGVPQQESLATAHVAATAPVAASSAVVRNLVALIAAGVLAVAVASIVLWKQKSARFYG